MTKLPTLAALLGVPVGFLFGDWTIMMNVLLTLVFLDVISGLMKGFYKKSLRSRTMMQGGMHKMSIAIMVIIANMLDVTMFSGISVCKTAVIFYYVAMEGISILENLGQMNFPMPPFIRENLELLKNRGSKIDIIKEVDKIIIEKGDEQIKLETKK